VAQKPSQLRNVAPNFESYANQKRPENRRQTQRYDFESERDPKDTPVMTGGALRVWDRKIHGTHEAPRRVVVEDDYNDFDEGTSAFLCDARD